MTDQAVKERDPAEAPDLGVLARPRVDVLETENEVLMLADLPGVNPDAVDVRFENGELTIHGRRLPSNAGKKRALTEYEPTHYHRSFRLTEDVAADRIEAELKNGVLTVRLPKAEAAKPRRIAVKG
jgi:HSP20 family protein